METKLNSEFANDLIIDSLTKSYLSETAKWASFIAILGFIGLGFIALGGLFFLIFGTSLPFSSNSYLPFGSSIFIGMLYLLLAVLYYFPISYLYRFSTNIKAAVLQNNQHQLKLAFQHLKSHYKFIGILMVIMIAIYALSLISILFSVFMIVAE